MPADYAPLADAHLHPQAIASKEAISAWRQNGLRHGLVAAASIDEWPRVMALAESSDDGDLLRAAIGIHPWHLPANMEEALEALENAIDKDGGQHIAAVGEVGLDSRHDGVPPAAIQYEWLRRQCQIALRHRLPVVLHICGDWEGLFRLVKELPELEGIVHGFSGNAFQAGEVLRKSRLALSIGPMLLRKGAPLAKAAAAIPLPRLLVESDAPYGRRLTDGPAVTPDVCREIIGSLAAIRNQPADELSRAICANWEELFG